MINKKTFLLVLTSISILLFNCSKDDSALNNQEQETPQGPLQLLNHYTVDTSTWLDITPSLKNFTNPSVTWTQLKHNLNDQQILLSDNETLNFITLEPGKYNIQIKVLDQGSELEQTFVIEVLQKNFKSHITQVFDFMPSYGQFVNQYPKYEIGDTKASMIHKAQVLLSKPKADLVSLGGFGGYIEFGFDHSVVNVPGRADFKVLGNSFLTSNTQILTSGASEPGIILVGVDKNKNGKPDPDEWYQIAGSQYHDSKTTHNYQITYYKPSAELDAVKGQVLNYVKWEDNQNNQGYKPKNASHTQSYFPLWITEDKITFQGTRLADNATKNQSNWEFEMYDYGYADNYPNTHDKSAIDISWAVDKNGNKVELKAIDFVRVYSAINQQMGVLGESSTEVTGAIDLHIEQINISTL